MWFWWLFFNIYLPQNSHTHTKKEEGIILNKSILITLQISFTFIFIFYSIFKMPKIYSNILFNGRGLPNLYEMVR